MKVHKVEITKEMILRAEKKSKMHGDINNSIRKGEGNVVGYLGEEMALAFLSDVVEKNTFDYDMVRFQNTPHVYTIDVKTKERGASKKNGRAYEPRDNYSVHVATASLHQNVDSYVFAQVNKVKTGYEGWILGWMDKKEFLAKSEVVKKGQLDEDGWPESTNAHKMRIKDIIHY